MFNDFIVLNTQIYMSPYGGTLLMDNTAATFETIGYIDFKLT